MQDKRFHKIVVLEPKLGRHRYVRSAADTARVLLKEWPAHRGEKYLKAQHAVLEVLKGRKSPSFARNALIKAADESRILVDADPVVVGGTVRFSAQTGTTGQLQRP